MATSPNTGRRESRSAEELSASAERNERVDGQIRSPVIPSTLPLSFH